MKPTKVAPKAKRAALKFFDGAPKGVLSGHIDRYNGISIDADKIAAGITPETFREQLTSTIQEYKVQGFRGVWLKLGK